MYLYIHGFLSSSRSNKAQQFKQWLCNQGREAEFLCPDLPVEPVQAMALLSELIERSPSPLKLIGSSLGGFYATALSDHYDLKAVLVNPAVHAGLVLQKMIGAHHAYHDQTKTPIIFTQAHANDLHQFDKLSLKKPENFFVLLEKGDDTLDYRLAINYYHGSSQLIFNDGNHLFTRFQQTFALIDAF